ncbi:hypothetical protein [Methylorubrum extorquens]
MKRHRTQISLCITHPNHPAAEICAALPFAPGRTWDAGMPRRNATGTVLLSIPSHETYCTFPLGDGAGLPAQAVAAAADRMAPHRELFSTWRAQGGRIEFFVGWSAEGGNACDRFEPALLARLGALGVGLSLDIYPLPDEGCNDEAESKFESLV